LAIVIIITNKVMVITMIVIIILSITIDTNMSLRNCDDKLMIIIMSIIMIIMLIGGDSCIGFVHTLTIMMIKFGLGSMQTIKHSVCSI